MMIELIIILFIILKFDIDSENKGKCNFCIDDIFFCRKRNEWEGTGEEKIVEANEDATGVELHKDSKFYQSWQSFKDTNPVVNKFVDYR